MSEDKERKDVGAIWVMKDTKGHRYLSMTVTIDGEKKQFVAFKNRKAKPTHPDYRLYPSKPRDKGESKAPSEEQPF